MIESGERPVIAESRLVALAVAAAGCLRLFYLWLKTDGQLVMFIPDDAFYYLVPARNFAKLGRWTFDGVEPATGFHLLWGYSLALLFKIDPNLSLHGVLAIAGLLQVLSLALGAYALTRVSVRMFGPRAGWGVGAVFLSSCVLLQGGSLMESAFVICIGACSVEWLSRKTLAGTLQTIVVPLALGWLLEMARSDAGLLTAALFLFTIVMWRVRKANRSTLTTAAMLLTGAVLGLVTILLHTHAVSGAWVQASAQEKLFWSTLAHNSARTTFALPMSVLQPLHNAVAPYEESSRTMLALLLAGHIVGRLMGLLVGVGALLCARRASLQVRALLLTMSLLIIAYCFFYQHDGATMDWYVSNYVAPMSLLCGAAAAWYSTINLRITQATASLLMVCGVVCSMVAITPWQESMYRAGIYLRDHPQAGATGAFNAGTIGFFAAGRVVNLDGLVNDRILPYGVHGRLAEYMALRHVTSVFDSPYMWQDSLMQRRGGYADGKLVSCMRGALDTFPDDPNNHWAGEHIHLYTFDQDCLRAAYAGMPSLSAKPPS